MTPTSEANCKAHEVRFCGSLFITCPTTFLKKPKPFHSYLDSDGFQFYKMLLEAKIKTVFFGEKSQLSFAAGAGDRSDWKASGIL